MKPQVAVAVFYDARGSSRFLWCARGIRPAERREADPLSSVARYRLLSSVHAPPFISAENTCACQSAFCWCSGYNYSKMAEHEVENGEEVSDSIFSCYWSVHMRCESEGGSEWHRGGKWALRRARGEALRGEKGKRCWQYWTMHNIPRSEILKTLRSPQGLCGVCALTQWRLKVYFNVCAAQGMLWRGFSR